MAIALCEAFLIVAPVFAVQAAVPKPGCRKGDHPESGMQGETTAAERDSGPKEYNCNADLVGQVQGEGASWQLAAWKNCAYYDQANNPSGLQQPGTVVVDVSNPSHPVVTDHLMDPSGVMNDPWESLKVNAPRQLLGGAQRPGPGFAIYDISADCRHPVLKSSTAFSVSKGHAGQWAPDGNTYYVTTITNNPSIVAIDTTDVTAPKVIMTWIPPSNISPIFHDLEFSKDGNTAYQTTIGGLPVIPAATQNGLLVLDVSDIQQRRPNPTIRIIGQTIWNDGSIIAQNALPIRIGGKPYVLFTDEAGSFRDGLAAGQAACAAGKSVNGFPRLIDVSNPAAPTTVGKLQIEMADPAHCAAALQTIPISATGDQFFGYSCHYCNVDDADNATVAACSCFSAGLRFFDIRDPSKPKELGYFKPPAQGTKTLPGSQYFLRAGAGFNHPVDWSPAKPSFPKDRGMTSGDIWATFQDNGFTVVHLDRGSSGCNTGGGSFGALLGLGALALLKRRGRRR